MALEQTGTTRYEAVRKRLEGVFRAYGMSGEMPMDHGMPWGNRRLANGWPQLSI